MLSSLSDYVVNAVKDVAGAILIGTPAKKYLPKDSYSPFSTPHTNIDENNIIDENAIIMMTPIRVPFNGHLFPLTFSTSRCSKLTPDAKYNVILDNEWLQRNNPKVVKSKKKVGRPNFSFTDELSKHYGVSESTVKSILSKKDELPRSYMKGSNKKDQLTLENEQIIIKTWNGLPNQTVHDLKASLSLNSEFKWESRYKGETFNVPSINTLRTIMKDKSIFESVTLCSRVSGALCSRPPLTLEHIDERLKFVTHRLLENNVRNSFDIDECNIKLENKKSRTFLFKTGSDAKSEIEADQELDSLIGNYKQHPVNAFFIAVVTNPTVLNQKDVDELGSEPIFHPTQNGKIGLFSMIGVHERKKRRRDDDGVFIELENDSPVYTEVTFNAARYALCHCMNGGFLDLIDQYLQPGFGFSSHQTCKKVFISDTLTELTAAHFVPVKHRGDMRGTVVEDNAGGHGTQTNSHKVLEKAYEDRRLLLQQQARKSPELNMLDCGVWRLIKMRFKRHISSFPKVGAASEWELREKMFEAVKIIWDEITPLELYNIARQKQFNFEEVQRLEGRSIILEEKVKKRS